MRKTPVVAAFLTFLLFLVSGLNAHADKGHLFFSGKIISGDRAVDKVVIKVFRQGQEITYFNVKPNGNFSVYLELQTNYELRLNSEGYQGGTIKISTSLPSSVESNKFEAYTEIDLAKKSNTSKEYQAYVWFNKSQQKFILSKTPLIESPSKAVSFYEDGKQSAIEQKDPQTNLYNKSEKSATTAYNESQKQKLEEVRANAGTKAESNANMLKSMAEAEKKTQGDQEERKEEDRYKKVTVIVVGDENKKNIYRKVEYKWGSVYYYKNGEQISERTFLKETKTTKNKESANSK